FIQRLAMSSPACSLAVSAWGISISELPVMGGTGAAMAPLVKAMQQVVPTHKESSFTTFMSVLS
ncbi:hypothetical protein, partial [Vibrio parahaemolyticus]|uniref:hypothetical protein n=1 Tax=Vibrio parahaemolyticus TaxID=670 RepID=UPI001C5EE615